VSQKPIATDEDLNAAYSRFKIWISFKDGRNKTFYAKEKDATFRQILFGKVQSVIFNHEEGFNKLIYLAETYYIGKYHTAIIYDRLYPNTPIRKYINGIMAIGSVEVEFTTQSKQTAYALVKQDGKYTLQQATPEIDFKQEISNQLLKK
jgi:hypothetical protein